MTKVTTTEQLREMIAQGVHDFFIQLNFGGRSSKFMDYSPKDKRYLITNEIDGSKQRLNEKNLFNRRWTNVGYAIQQGSFFSYEDYEYGNREYTLSDGSKIMCLGMCPTWDEAAVKLLENGSRGDKQYVLMDTDSDMVSAWIDMAKAEDRPTYAKFLEDAVEQGATIMTLDDVAAGWHQTLGEVIIY